MLMMNPKHKKLNAQTTIQKLKPLEEKEKSFILLSFKFCDSKIGFRKFQLKQLPNFIRDISNLTNKTWDEAIKLPRQTNLGYEQIHFQKNRFSEPLPQGFAEDIKLDVFRICNQKARLIGKKSAKEPSLFYVFWVDFDLCVYDHG